MKLINLLKEEIGDENDPRPVLDWALQNKENNLFIRFGKYGNKSSKVRMDVEFRNDVLGGKVSEAGLSVYFVEQKGNKWIIQPPESKQASYHLGNSYFNDMLFDIFANSISKEEVYILKGDLVEIEYKDYDYGRDEFVLYKTFIKGSDGEPVIDPSSISIIKQFNIDEILNNIYYNNTNISLGDHKQDFTRIKLRNLIELNADE